MRILLKKNGKISDDVKTSDLDKIKIWLRTFTVFIPFEKWRIFRAPFHFLSGRRYCSQKRNGEIDEFSWSLNPWYNQEKQSNLIWLLLTRRFPVMMIRHLTICIVLSVWRFPLFFVFPNNIDIVAGRRLPLLIKIVLRLTHFLFSDTDRGRIGFCWKNRKRYLQYLLLEKQIRCLEFSYLPPPMSKSSRIKFKKVKVT